MDYLFDIFLISLSAALINNFVLYYFVGICPFIGVSRQVDMALGMGGAVTFVMTIAVLISWSITTFVLMPGAPVSQWVAGFFMAPEKAAEIDLTILTYIVYIFSISSSVQTVVASLDPSSSTSTSTPVCTSARPSTGSGPPSPARAPTPAGLKTQVRELSARTESPATSAMVRYGQTVTL